MRIYPSDFFEERRYKINPKLCFVLMPFNEQWSQRTYKILKEIVEGLGFECKRGDDFYGKIVLKDIWHQINEAAFIIADLSGINPNVYYELGIAHTLGKEIIPVLQKGTDIPFDQRPFRILFYEDNLDGYQVLQSELPKWIANLSYKSSPQMMLKNEMVDSFNDWRNLGKPIRFIGEDFSELNLQGIDLSNAVLNETSMQGCNLNESNLSKAFLIRTDLRNASFKGSNLHQANLSEANLELSDFCKANLTECIILRANLSQANFKDSDVQYLTIDHTTYQKFQSVFEGAINKNRIIVEK